MNSSDTAAMFTKRILWRVLTYSRLKSIKPAIKQHNRSLHVSTALFKQDASKKQEIALRNSFESQPNKTKSNYLQMIEIFTHRDVHRRGHVEFIYAALKHMKLYNVQGDLEVYKALIEVFPKGKMIPQNILQSEFMHYPKQQQCAIDLLEQMEDNGVMPDAETEAQLLSVFGKRGHPLRKYWRMMYWMPKFKNLSPWPVPNPPPESIFDLAKMAIDRISSVDMQSVTSIYQSSDLEDSIDDTWIISAQSPMQKKLLKEINEKDPIYIEGYYKIWLRNKSVNYFVLRAAPKPILDDTDLDPDDVSQIKFSRMLGFGLPPKDMLSVVPSVHEQEDGVILAVCATGTSSKDSLLSWIRLLEKNDNPYLEKLSVVFTLKTAEKEIATFEEDQTGEAGVEPKS